MEGISWRCGFALWFQIVLARATHGNHNQLRIINDKEDVVSASLAGSKGSIPKRCPQSVATRGQLEIARLDPQAWQLP
jgi:hypothetical protein